jgi:hypothetical protein
VNDNDKWLWAGRPWQAFKNFVLIFSFVLNLVFLALLILGATVILPAVQRIASPIVAGLNQSFVDMGQATITRTIVVQDEIPISLQTQARLTEAVPMSVPTSFVLPGGGGNINGTVFFDLPAGVQLPISLDMTVPVSQTVPIEMAVAVDIPLSETELGRPFSDLQGLFAPLDAFLSGLPEQSAAAEPQQAAGN